MDLETLGNFGMASAYSGRAGTGRLASPLKGEMIAAMKLIAANTRNVNFIAAMNVIICAGEGFDVSMRVEKSSYDIVAVIRRLTRGTLMTRLVVMMVLLTPAATPLCVGGTEPITELALGDLKKPMPNPATARAPITASSGEAVPM